MFFWGNILALLVGGIAGWWWGRSQTKSAVDRQWMTALESAETDRIIDEDQRSQIIRIQGALR
jgi:hypothetical protein